MCTKAFIAYIFGSLCRCGIISIDRVEYKYTMGRTDDTEMYCHSKEKISVNQIGKIMN